MANEEYTSIFDQQQAARMVTAANEGNELANTEFAKDIRTAPYGVLKEKYGVDVAENRYLYARERVRQDRINSAKPGVGQALVDAGASFAAGTVNTVGSLGAAPLGIAGAGWERFIDEDDTSIRDASQYISESTKVAADFFTDLQSEELKARQQLTTTERDLDTEDNLAKYNRETNDGKNATFTDDLSWFGREVLDNAGRVGSDPLLATDTVMQGLGSAGPSMGIAGLASKAITGTRTFNAAKIANAVAPTQGTRFLAAGAEVVNRGAIAGTVGLSEASGIYTETVNEILGLKHGELLTMSPDYAKMVENGVDQDDAKATLAANAGVKAFSTAFPSAVIGGLVAGKFEAMPIATFRGSGFMGGLRTIGAQTLEEGFQGFSGEVSKNYGIRDEVDSERDLMQGVGEAVGVGMIAGAGMAGTFSAPATINGSAAAASEAIRNTEIASRAASMLSAAASGGATVLDGVQKVGEAAAKTKAGVATINAATSAATATRNVVEPVVEATNERIKEFNERPDREAQAADLASVSRVAKTGIDILRKGVPDDPNRSEEDAQTLLDSLMATKAMVLDPSDGDVSEAFKITTKANAPTLGRIQGVLTKLTEKGVRIDKLSTTDILYAANEIQKLRNNVQVLPTELREDVISLVNSTEINQIRKRAYDIDLKKTQPDDVEITNDVVQETLAVAQINPVNSNPEVIARVLKHENAKNLTPEKVKMMETAKRISQAIKSRVDAQITLETDRNVALSIKPEYADGKKTLPEIKNVSNISVDLSVGSSKDKPSVAGYTGMIMEGLQSEDGKVLSNGTRVDVQKSVIPRFNNLAQHMINKVKAVNQSFDQADANGQGPNVQFDGLSNDGTFVKAGSARAPKSVYYRVNSPKSVVTVREIHADAVATVEAYNALAEAYPDKFLGGPLTVPELRGFETTNVEETSEEVTEEIVEEIPTSTDTSSVEVIEEAPVVVEETNTPPTTPIDYTSMNEEQRIESINTVVPEGMSFEKMDPVRQKVVTNIIQPLSEFFGLPDDIVFGVAWLRTNKTFNLGRAMFGQRMMGLRAGVVKNLMKKKDSVERRKAEHVVYHEFGHLLDSSLSNDDLTRSQKSDLYSLDGGAIHAETIAANKAGPFKGRMDYLMTFNTIETMDLFAVEAFAEVAAFYFQNPELTREYFPEGVKDVEAAIIEAGGKISTDGATSPNVRSESDPSQSAVEEVTEDEVESINTRDFNGLNPKFKQNFKKDGNSTVYSDGYGILYAIEQDGEGTENYVAFMDLMVKDLVDAVNARLKKIPGIDMFKKNVAWKDVQEGKDVTHLRPFKNMIMVDSRTGEYDEGLISIAAVAVLDWLTAARNGQTKPINKVITEDMNMTMDMVTGEDIKNITQSMPLRQTVDELTGTILRMWGMKIDDDATFADGQGVIEALVKELLASVVQMRNESMRTDSDSDKGPIKSGLLETVVVPYYDKAAYDRALSEAKNNDERNAIDQMKFVRKQTSLRVTDIMVSTQKDIGLKSQGAAKKLYAPEFDTMPSIGIPPEKVDMFDGRGTTKLSKMVRRALARMQNQGHKMSSPLSDMTSAIGFENLSLFLGETSVDDLAEAHPLRASKAGKNLSIERDFREAMSVVDAIKSSPLDENGQPPRVFYKVGVTSVGRHQFKGINPQNNKILRAMVTPTWSMLDMTTQKHQNAFWLTIAQAADMYKVEGKHHRDILDNIQESFQKEYGEAVSQVETYLETGELDSALFVENMGGTGEMQQIAAVFAVAQYRKSVRDGTNARFETSLSFELDGKTDGPGNMMVNFGQGILSMLDYNNFKRIGLFVGSTNMTLNDYYGDGGQDDLYMTMAKIAQEAFSKKIAMASKEEVPILNAVGNFAGVFGDMEINANGEFVMVRNTAKNPMTKVGYGASDFGVGSGLTGDMMVELYQQLVDGKGQISGYPDGMEGFKRDFEILFGMKYNEETDWTKNYIHPKNVKKFGMAVTSTLGNVLATSAKQLFGTKVTNTNDALVMMTGFQGHFLQLKFNQMFEELIQTRVKEGKIALNKNGIPNRGMLTKRDYNTLISQIRKYSPTYANALQTLTISQFSAADSGIVISQTMDGSFQIGTTLQKPGLPGVKVIPYVTIGRGDAMMMNWIYSDDDLNIEGTLNVFDGVDMPIEKIFEYAKPINAAVLKNWKSDVLGDIVKDVESFMNNVASADNDLKDMAWKLAVEEAESKGNEYSDTSEPEVLQNTLNEMHRFNMARKKVFEKLGISIDHMGGSSTAYVQNENVKDMSLGEINDMIQAELRGITVEVVTKENKKTEEQEDQQEQKPMVTVNSAKNAINFLKKNKNKMISDGVRVIEKANLKSRVIFGSQEEIDKWYKDNIKGTRDGLTHTHKGFYDPENDVIAIIDANPETVLHELIHAATFKIVQTHYEGSNTTNVDTVKRLEDLMDEFMKMDFSKSSEKVKDAVNQAKAQILVLQVEDNAFAKAGALNEFMAWTLSNESLVRSLKKRETPLVERLTKKVKALMQRLLGGIKKDVYSNILFNTELLVTEITEEDYSDPVSQDTGELTPVAQNMTNFWIDMMSKRLEDAKNTIGYQKQKTALNRISTYRANAAKAAENLHFGGFNLSPYQQETFRAIHTILSMEMRLNPQSALALNKLFTHISNNLTPEMFGTQDAQDRYSAVMDTMGSTNNNEGVSDAIAVLLALSQTSTVFRNAIDQIPSVDAEGKVSTESVNDILSTLTAKLVNKAVGTVSNADQSMTEALDDLSQSLLIEESDKEFRFLSEFMNKISMADAYTSGLFTEGANRMAAVNARINASDRSDLTKVVVGTATAAMGFLDQDRYNLMVQGSKEYVYFGETRQWATPFRELITEIAGTDEKNRRTVAMLDEVTYAASNARQSFREDLPVLMKEKFSTPPTKEQWKSAQKVLAATDFSFLYEEGRPNAVFDLIKDENILDDKIKDSEAIIKANWNNENANNILKKSQQLADFMTGKGAGHMLLANAYAINKLAGVYVPHMTEEIDRLVSLYALKGSDPQARREINRMYTSDPKAMENLVVYLKALNKEENEKTITEKARLQGYKGFIPNEGKLGTKIIIARESSRRALEKKGYKYVAPAPADENMSIERRSYYVTSTKQNGTYSQGAMQIIQDTYRGVDATTGLTVNGTTSGVISGSEVDTVTDQLLQDGTVADGKETLKPVFDPENIGEILFYERVINPDLLEKHTTPESNLALMLGVWSGRQVEEKISQSYNEQLVLELKRQWNEKGRDEEGLFVNLPEEAERLKTWNEATPAQRKARRMIKPDQIFVDSWNVIPPQTKQMITEVFGEGEFWVRKDQMNIALGYRDPSIVDIWTGNTRLPEGLQQGVQAMASILPGKSAMKTLAKFEEITQGLVGTAKDLIVVRSLIVPYMNTQANVIQLSSRGVPFKKQINSYPAKLTEIERFNENRTRLIDLDTQILLAGTDTNQVRILNKQKQVIEDENKRMSIEPLIRAGAYKNISEGLTEMDVEITSGRLGDWIEKQVDRIPTTMGARTIAKYGILSRDTAIYKGANKAVQYGDFIAKAILYDFLQEKGMSHEDIMYQVNEEFVNFSVLPGRTRQYLEGTGFTWFMSFKLRILKIAINQLQKNPVRSLMLGATISDLGSPQADNIVAGVVDGSLDYSLGHTMLFESIGLNPLLNITE